MKHSKNIYVIKSAGMIINHTVREAARQATSFKYVFKRYNKIRELKFKNKGRSKALGVPLQ